MIREQFNYFDVMSTLSLSAQRPNFTGYPPLSALLVREVIASKVSISVLMTLCFKKIMGVFSRGVLTS